MDARRDSLKHLAIEGWVFVVIAVIAFATGYVVGDFGASPKTETVYTTPSNETETEAGAGMAGGEPMHGMQEAGGNSAGAQLFTGVGCGGCHALAAAGTSGVVGPNLNEFLAPDDTTESLEEMIVDPNAELAEGYPANVMPQDYGQTLSKAEVQQLSEYLVATTPAKPNP